MKYILPTQKTTKEELRNDFMFTLLTEVYKGSLRRDQQLHTAGSDSWATGS